MIDLVNLLNNSEPTEDRDYYIPTAEEARQARVAYETLRREEMERENAEHGMTDGEFQEYLLSVAAELVADGDLDYSDLLELQEELENLED